MSYPVSGSVKSYRAPGYAADHPLVPHGFSVILNAPAVFRFTARGEPGAAPAGGRGARRRCVGRHARTTPGSVLADRITWFMQRLKTPNGLARARLHLVGHSRAGRRHAAAAPRDEAVAAPGRPRGAGRAVRGRDGRRGNLGCYLRRPAGGLVRQRIPHGSTEDRRHHQARARGGDAETASWVRTRTSRCSADDSFRVFDAILGPPSQRSSRSTSVCGDVARRHAGRPAPVGIAPAGHRGPCPDRRRRQSPAGAVGNELLAGEGAARGFAPAGSCRHAAGGPLSDAPPRNLPERRRLASHRSFGQRRPSAGPSRLRPSQFVRMILPDESGELRGQGTVAWSIAVPAGESHPVPCGH